MPTSSTTNRLTTAGTQYDAEGNLVLWNSGPSYEYDAFNRMRRFRGGVAPGSEEWVFAYTADDERVFSARVGGGGTVWSLRGLDNQLLREWRAEDGKHSFRDYVWTGRNLLAKIERTPAAGSPGWSEETRHAAVDHLGSVRLWTDAAGANLPGFIYYPFGKQLNSTVDDEQMRFTGHERDLWNTTSSNDDLDYMHARHYNPQLGRFLQIDPLAGSVRAPQTLNRYAYVASNPINYTDPTGMLMNAWDCGYNEDPPHTSTIAGGVQVNTTWVVFGCSGGGQSPQLTDRGYGWGGPPGRRGTPTGSPNPTLPSGGPEDPPEDPPKDPPGDDDEPCLGPPSPGGVRASLGVSRVLVATARVVLGPLLRAGASLFGGPVADAVPMSTYMTSGAGAFVAVMSAPGSVWDVKGDPPRFQNYGNFLFGVNAARAGVPMVAALFGAGMVPSDPSSASPPFGDDFRDTAWIATGYGWAKNCE